MCNPANTGKKKANRAVRKTAVVRAYARFPFFPFAHLRTEAFHLPNDFSPLSLTPRPAVRVIIITISLPPAARQRAALPRTPRRSAFSFICHYRYRCCYYYSLSLSFSILSLLLTKLSGRFDNRHRQRRVAARQTAHLMNPGRTHGSIVFAGATVAA